MATVVEYIINLKDRGVESKFNKLDSRVGRLDKSMMRLAGRFALFAGAAGVVTKSIKKIADFEESVSNLSAITGATGDDLDFLKRKAIELGAATTKTSQETVEAFKLIASAKPELLEDAAALSSVTKEAIALAEASGLDLPDAARNLAETLNQFSAGADQASRFINVLAAGSKLSAAEIPEVSMAIKEFGVNAKDAGISVEQSVAAIETLAEKGVKGQRAGIQIRNVLLKLAASTDKRVNPEIVGLSDSLENLAKKNLSTAQLTKMFGRQNIIAAKTLIQNRNRVDDLTEALTGTNIAYEQQRVNTDNLNSDLKRLNSAWEGFILNLNKGEGAISKTLRSATQDLTEFINKLDFANKTREERDKSATESARENLAATLKGLKDEEKIREAIVNHILFEKKLRSDELSELKNLEGFRTTQVGAFLFGADALQRKNVLSEVRAEREAIIKDLTNLLSDPIAFRKFANAVQGGAGLAPALTGAPTITQEAAQLNRTITGAAPKVFNINISKLVGVENLINQKTTLRETALDVGNAVLNEMTKALADTQTVVQ